MAPDFFFPQIFHPVVHNLVTLVTDREEIRDKRLTELGSGLSRKLENAFLNHIHMLQFHRGDGTISCPGQEGEGNQRTIPSFNIRVGLHSSKNVLDFLYRRHRPLSAGFGDPCVLLGQIEILGIGLSSLGRQHGKMESVCQTFVAILFYYKTCSLS